ncbi:hypothetical protein GCM10011494_11390 [Novosphingobium endophyticum]|uniref:NAD-dependent epimerase/dehydratase domain-containing protein n=1 Tax=Novosphingobium endophyticum TaxID=1955250 RepID=A0A916TS16_9SPHN|nr:NAD-dependent epimerase/dehydratase family protein [Novosphingobium endophyticum]GGB94640.1 hypothetical protein GCM10011494_11390 [Novosphingobium endophyticum]
MQVLVTGANGFVGRQLVRLLSREGHIVRGHDLTTESLEACGADSMIAGDLGDPAIRQRALRGTEAVIHLATVPGGAAERDPSEGRRINVDATMAFADEFAALMPGAPFVAASSIGVFGQPFPPKVVDTTPVAPYMYYGAHKAIMEIWLGTLARRGQLSALSIRLPGIIARPAGSETMKSAFMSNVFHALRAGREISLPVEPSATLWLMSLGRIADNFVHALKAVKSSDVPESAAITLPAIRLRMDELVAEIARQTGANPKLVSYDVDPAMQEGFGQQPPLETPAAERLGFRHDGDVASLVKAGLAAIEAGFA